MVQRSRCRLHARDKAKALYVLGNLLCDFVDRLENFFRLTLLTFQAREAATAWPNCAGLGS